MLLVNKIMPHLLLNSFKNKTYLLAVFNDDKSKVIFFNGFLHSTIQFDKNNNYSFTTQFKF